jgi:tetratricopeptide (TPR) repeat protein
MTEKKPSWLIRDNTNVIRGPFSHHEVLQLIKKGQLKAKTEVATANSYWFALEEKVEVAKFFPELGLKTAEQPTTMTATLTQADVSDHALEATQVIPASKVPQPAPGPENEEIQWLSDEFADEFGEELTGAAGANSGDESNPNTQEIVLNNLLDRSSVKADTLPSEQKDFKGERPKPIDNILKSKEKAAAASPNMVQLPVEKHDSPMKILAFEEKAPSTPLAINRRLLLLGAMILVVALAVPAFMFKGTKAKHEKKSAITFERKTTGNPEVDMRHSLLLFELEDAKAALIEMKQMPGAKNSVVPPLADALMKKEFLFDADGAYLSLQAAEALAKEPGSKAEVGNLLAVYGFERDKGESIGALRRIADSQSDPVFRYNLALAQLRAGHAKEAAATVNKVNQGDNRLVERSLVLLGWARDILSKGNDPAAEDAYQKALNVNPNSAKARLGIAIYHFRKGGMRASDHDFRSFIEDLPELDPPSLVPNFRQMSDFEFYSYARSQLRELNIPLGAAGSKPSPLVMAVDAILSCLENRTGEAGKILDVALTAAPGDPSILKAVGYHRFKDGRYAEVIDLLKELGKESESSALSLLLGKSYLKTGHEDLAQKEFERMTAANPSRSEGWSLLGMLQLRHGARENAKKNLHNALSRNPLDLQALRGLDRLGEPVLANPELSQNLPF